MNRDMAIFRDPMPIIVEIQSRSIEFLNVDYESMQVSVQIITKWHRKQQEHS